MRMNIVDFRATIPGEKLEKNEKKTHRFNVVWQIAYVCENKTRKEIQAFKQILYFLQRIILKSGMPQCLT